MKYQEITDYSFLLGENHYIYKHTEDDDTLHLFVKSRPHEAKCPYCGMVSRSLHATYERVLQDTPIHCKQTYLHANVYKYDCENPDCDHTVLWKTFHLLRLHSSYRCIEFVDSWCIYVPQ